MLNKTDSFAELLIFQENYKIIIIACHVQGDSQYYVLLSMSEFYCSKIPWLNKKDHILLKIFFCYICLNTDTEAVQSDTNTIEYLPHVYYMCDTYVIHVWYFGCITQCNSYTCNTCVKHL